MNKRQKENDHVNDCWKKERENSVAELGAKLNRDKLKPIRPGHPAYLKALTTATVTLCVAPAGCGKTYMACGVAAQLLKDGVVDKIIITRPLVQCNGRNNKRETLGILPGTVNEKISPYMVPLLEAFNEFFSPLEVQKMLLETRIEIVPLELMRGRSIKRAYVICDEAQNAVYEQLHMLLTRLDIGSMMAIVGDASQSDLPTDESNALLEVIKKFSFKCHPRISIVKLTRADIVRPDIVRWVDERLAPAANGELDDDTFPA